MTQSLRELARAHGQDDPPAALISTEAADGGAVMVTGPLPDISYTAPIEDADSTVPVAVAWARVMADVQSIAKGDQRNDSGGRYAFRGVDRVVNAVGPALRRHGVLVLPVRVYDVAYTESKTKSGGTMQEATLKVQWAIVGPAGDQLPHLLESAGQAQDTQDKATSKAVSVAQRMLFLTALHIPTQDPDIDKGYDRGEQVAVSPNRYRDEILHPDTSLGRLRQIRGEVARHQIGGVIVTNESGDEEALAKLLSRIGTERASAGEGPAAEEPQA